MSSFRSVAGTDEKKKYEIDRGQIVTISQGHLQPKSDVKSTVEKKRFKEGSP